MVLQTTNIMSMTGNLFRVSNTELNNYLKDSYQLEEAIYSDDEQEKPNLIDIDKAWDGIIFLLTGKSVEEADNPLVRVLFSGQLIDENQDLGYGPAHYLTPNEVKELNEEVSKMVVKDVIKKYDAKKMTALEVYPNDWDDSEMAGYLAEYFTIVQEFYAEAAKRNEAIITFLN